MAKFKVVCMFMLGVWASVVILFGLFRLYAPNHADNPFVAGLGGIIG